MIPKKTKQNIGVVLFLLTKKKWEGRNRYTCKHRLKLCSHKSSWPVK
jgi:hypothetical protein